MTVEVLRLILALVRLLSRRRLVSSHQRRAGRCRKFCRCCRVIFDLTENGLKFVSLASHHVGNPLKCLHSAAAKDLANVSEMLDFSPNCLRITQHFGVEGLCM